MGRLIEISPIVGHTIQKKEYQYPFEELKDILKNFEGKAISSYSNFFDGEFKYTLDEFKDRTLGEQGIRQNDPDYDLFGFLIKSGSETGSIRIKCRNLFTACVLFGKHVPSWILGNEKEYTFKNGDCIVFNEVLDDYTMIKGIEISTVNIPLTKSSGIIDVELVKKELNLENLTTNKLEKLSYKLSGIRYTLVKDELNKRKEVQLQKFRIKNPGVPDNAIQIISGKTYSGRADGDFEVKTINGKVWFIPIGSCCDFYETDDNNQRK